MGPERPRYATERNIGFKESKRPQIPYTLYGAMFSQAHRVDSFLTLVSRFLFSFFVFNISKDFFSTK